MVHLKLKKIITMRKKLLVLGFILIGVSQTYAQSGFRSFLSSLDLFDGIIAFFFIAVVVCIVYFIPILRGLRKEHKVNKKIISEQAAQIEIMNNINQIVAKEVSLVIAKFANVLEKYPFATRDWHEILQSMAGVSADLEKLIILTKIFKDNPPKGINAVLQHKQFLATLEMLETEFKTLQLPDELRTMLLEKFDMVKSNLCI